MGENDDKLAKALIYNNIAMRYLDMNKLKDVETYEGRQWS